MTHIVIVGGGFSGALLAINLVRHDGPRATLIERRGAVGRGTAYSTVHPDHLLNVRAANMSAYPDDPNHFTRWLAARSGHDGSEFVPRRLYGDYLEELLHAAVAKGDGRLSVVRGDAVDIEAIGARRRVLLADGQFVDGDIVALAVGNLPPAPPACLDPELLKNGQYVGDPWSSALAADLGPNDTIVVLGTGLTMVDVALLLDAEAFAGRIVAISRRGLLPLSHQGGTPPSSRSERPATDPIGLLQALRQRAAEVPWRAAVDELRPYTQGLWRAMSIEDRSRFLRHLRPWWDIHRHRLAPVVAQRLERMQSSGRLEIVAGRILSATPTSREIKLSYKPRGSDRVHDLNVSKLINATGPEGDLARVGEPVLRALWERGWLRADPLGIGLDVDQDSRAIGREGEVSEQLLVLGPMTRGAFWEIVAVPDIRRQAWSVARRLAGAHWVEGEGL